jgi:ABC-2 type transport system permease protein
MKLLQHKYWWLILIALFVITIFVSNNIHTKIDLTAENRFSISPATKELLQQLDDNVEIKVLLKGNLSSGFKKLSLATEELLSNFREVSRGKLNFSFVKPGEGLNDTAKAYLLDSLAYLGVKPFNNELNREDGEKTEQIIFPTALITYKNKVKVVDLMSGKSGEDEESTLNFSEALLEFKFDDAIDKLIKKNHPIIAYALGNGEPNDARINDLIRTVSSNYRFGPVNLKNIQLDADSIKALLIVKPSEPFAEQDKIKIDQYIMQGGKVVWMIDKLYAEFDSLLRANRKEFIAFDKNLDIDDLLFKYGVRINNNLLQDLNCARQPLVVGESGQQPQTVRVPCPYYPLLSSASNHPISKNLDHILSIFPSSIDTVQAKGIKKTILLSSDTNSRLISSPNLVSMQNIGDMVDYRLYTESYKPVAVLLEGKFQSLFTNRLTQVGKDSAAKLTGYTFEAVAKNNTQQIVISDGDMVTNVISQTQGPLTMGTQLFENYTFANKDFLLNCLDYLVGNPAIIETRNKDYTLRLLDKVKVREEKSFWQLINILLPIVLVLSFGFLLHFFRKKKYTTK